jgi:hypothetical protein
MSQDFLKDFFKNVSTGIKKTDEQDVTKQHLKALKDSFKEQSLKDFLFPSSSEKSSKTTDLEETSTFKSLPETLQISISEAKTTIQSLKETSTEIPKEVLESFSEVSNSYADVSKAYESNLSESDTVYLRQLEMQLNNLKRTVREVSARSSGGGEVNLKYLDDVDYSTAQDGYVLVYDDSLGSFVFTARSNVCGQFMAIKTVTSNYTVTNQDFTVVSEPSTVNLEITLPTEAFSYISGNSTGQIINITQDPASYKTIIKNSVGNIIAEIPPAGGVINFQSTGTKWIRMS